MRRYQILILNIGLGVIVVVLFLILIKIEHRMFPPMDQRVDLCAWSFFVVGTFLITYAVYVLFRYSGASGVPGDPTKRIVEIGPYQWMRNPIYAGDILLLFGVSFYARSFILLMAAIISIPLFHLFVCFVEEPGTEKRLGDEYLDYKQRIPRWFPGISFGRKKTG